MNTTLSATALAALALAQNGYINHSSTPSAEEKRAVADAYSEWGMYSNYPYATRTGTAEFHPRISQRQRRLRARRQGRFPIRR